MASEVGICNRGLQLLGAKQIASLTEDHKNARACNTAYEPRRDAMLRAHPWRFATTRAQLAADATAPAFGRARAFTLPTDCLRPLPPYPEENLADRDWVEEGGKIYTNDSAPLNLRYVRRVTDPNQMDPLFREALSADLAYNLCEEITQSNTKKADAKTAKDDALTDARRTNAITGVPQASADDTWITARSP